MEASAITGAREHRQPRPRLRLAASQGRGKLRVGIIGTGNIGTDLLLKVQRSPLLECELFAGRNSSSAGIRTARELGVATSDRSIDAFLDEPDRFDLVFDATSAADAK